MKGRRNKGVMVSAGYRARIFGWYSKGLHIRVYRAASQSRGRYSNARKITLTGRHLSTDICRAQGHFVVPKAIVQQPVAQLGWYGESHSRLLAVGPQLIKVVRPRLHHLSPLRQSLRAIVGSPHRVPSGRAQAATRLDPGALPAHSAVCSPWFGIRAPSFPYLSNLSGESRRSACSHRAGGHRRQSRGTHAVAGR